MRGCLLLILVLAGCADVRIVVDEADTEALGIRFGPALATDGDGNVFALSAENVIRYDPGEHAVEELLRTNRRVVDLATTSDDVLLLLEPERLAAVYAGESVPILELPGRGVRVDARDGAAYLLVETSDGERGLLRYVFESAELQPLLKTADPLRALTAVRGGCLIAVGGAIHKVFVPADGDEAHTLLLLEATAVIESLAADEDEGVVFFADAETTYAYLDGRVVPLFPLGGQLAFSNGTLTILSPELGQVIQVDAPDERARELLEGVGQGVVLPGDERTSPAPVSTDAVTVEELEAVKIDGGLRVTAQLTNSGEVSVADLVLAVALNDSEGISLHTATLGVDEAIGPGQTIAVRFLVPRTTLAPHGVGQDDYNTVSLRPVEVQAAPVLDEIVLTSVEFKALGCAVGVENRSAHRIELAKVYVEHLTELGGAVLFRETLSMTGTLEPGSSGTFDCAWNDDPLLREAEKQAGQRSTAARVTHVLARVAK